MSVTAQECPNCGAPLTLVGTRCSFCQMPLTVTSDGGAAAAEVARSTDPDAPFAMQVDDVFFIKGRGTVVTGMITAGSIHVGAGLMIEGAGGTRATTCNAIEMFRKQLDTAVAGDKVGLLLDVIEKSQVTAGDWIRAT